MSVKLQETFPKFAYKQKVIEEMIVVAGNIHEKLQTSSRHIQEIGAVAHLHGTPRFHRSGTGAHPDAGAIRPHDA
jgi:hypothetical protein